MVDAATHLLTARLAGGLLRDPRMRAVLYLGVLWPDLLAKCTSIVLRCPVGFEVPSHSLAGLAIASAGAALLFRPPDRAGAWLMLMAGSALHLAADCLKDFGVFPGLRLLYPFSARAFSLGLIRSEDSAYLMPAAAALLLLIEWAARRRRGG